MAFYRCVGGGASGTAITPDNSASPPTLTQGETYTITGNNGLAIESASSLTPANTSPPSITSGNYYRASGGGYAISSYVSSGKTPTASGTSFDAGWNRMTSGGYAYSEKPSTISPSILTAGNTSGNTSTTLFSFNSSKSYVICISVNYSGTRNPNSQVIYTLVKGALSLRQRADGLSGISCTKGTSSITLNNSQNAQVSATVVQLD